jgi:aryl-alcohol dehydrogenase-like predicted oxidoreductase
MGEVDDDESIRAIRRAVELGVTVFGTAAVYGCGHSERVFGEALSGRFADVVVITKFGYAFDESSRQLIGPVPELTADSARRVRPEPSPARHRRDRRLPVPPE